MSLRMLFRVLPLFVAAGCLAEQRGGIFAEYTSPAGAYHVRLSGRPQPVPGGMVGGGVHVIRAEVRGGGRVVVPWREIHYADSMDDSFSEDYCKAEWAFENVLRFQSCYPLADAPHRTSDTVVLRNAGSQSTNFVQISTNTDMVIFLELPAQRDIRVPITGRTDQNWFHVRGLWADGQELPTASTFMICRPAAMSSRHCRIATSSSGQARLSA